MTRVRRVTGGEAVVECLLAYGVNTLFGLPGIQNDWLYNALYDARDAIRVIHTRHEQGAGYMALGYSLARGDIGVCSVVPGPGALNASAALATAYGLNARLLFISGQIPSPFIGRGVGMLHEIPDQLGVLASLTKWAARATGPAEIPTQLAQAFQQLRSGRPRPVALEIPMDVLAEHSLVELPPPTLPAFVPPVDPERIEAAAQLLGRSKAPLIYVGGGAQNASQAVKQLAELLQAPVVANRGGRGVLDSRHSLSLVQPAARGLWEQADVILVLGSNARTPLQAWAGHPERALIRIDVDASAHARIVRPTIAITARVEDALPQLIDCVTAHTSVRPSRAAELGDVQADWEHRAAALEPQRTYLRIIRDALGEHGVFVDEMTQVGYASRMILPVYHPHTFISTGYMGTLGYGFPTALGVQVARPEARILSISGDGGFLFGVAELATAVQHRIGLVALVFNNQQYGNVQMMQRELYGNRVIATDLHNPDFVRLAESFGAQGLRAETPEALRHALERGFHCNGPTVIEVPVGDLPSLDQFR